MQFNTPYGLADDQSASYLCGLQEGLSIGAITGGVNSGSGAGGGLLGTSGFVYVYDHKRKTDKVAGSCIWHPEGGVHYVDKEAFIAEYSSYFAPTNIAHTSGSFSVSDKDGNGYTIHGVKIIFKSGITMYVGYEDIVHPKHMVAKDGHEEACENTGRIWSGSNRAVIYGTNGDILWQYCNKGATAFYGLHDGGTWDSGGNVIKSNMIVEYFPGFMALHGDPDYANNGTTLTIWDLPTCTGIGYRGGVTFFDPSGGTVSYSNETTCFPSTSTEAHMPCHLNCFVNPEMYPGAEKYKLYLTKDKNGEVVHNTYVPMSYLKHNSLFGIYDPISGLAYNCAQLRCNAMQIIEQIEPPNISELMTT